MSDVRCSRCMVFYDSGGPASHLCRSNSPATTKTDYERDQDGLFEQPATPAAPRIWEACMIFQRVRTGNDLDLPEKFIARSDYDALEKQSAKDAFEKNKIAKDLFDEVVALKRQLDSTLDARNCAMTLLQRVEKERDEALSRNAYLQQNYAEARDNEKIARAEVERLRERIAAFEKCVKHDDATVHALYLERDRYRAALENIKVTLGRAAAVNLDATNGFEIAREALGEKK